MGKGENLMPLWAFYGVGGRVEGWRGGEKGMGNCEKIHESFFLKGLKAGLIGKDSRQGYPIELEGSSQ